MSALEVRALLEGDCPAAVDLWRACDLVVPWNDPVVDFARALASPTSTILGVWRDAQLVATAMVGFDGHRGWLYYVAVLEHLRRSGVGLRLLREAEDWLKTKGAPKSMLMVRRSNLQAIGFYEALGYSEDDVVVLAKRFES
ncbi:MAG: GNAT family acetyltransferase [Pseudomonadota bacterium]